MRLQKLLLRGTLIWHSKLFMNLIFQVAAHFFLFVNFLKLSKLMQFCF